MGDLYRIPTQQTYKGRTAGGWVKGAELATMAAGTIEIVSKELPGCLLHLTEDERLVIENFDGPVVALECSANAAAKLSALTRRADAKMRASAQ